MGTEIIDRVSQYIDALAANLGVAASHVYETMVRQTVLEGIVYTAASVLFVILGLFALIKTWKYALSEKAVRNGSVEFMAPICVVGSFVYAILTIGALINLPDTVMKVFNPEYFVIREILDVVKGAV